MIGERLLYILFEHFYRDFYDYFKLSQARAYLCPLLRYLYVPVLLERKLHELLHCF